MKKSVIEPNFQSVFGLWIQGEHERSEDELEFASRLLKIKILVLRAVGAIHICIQNTEDGRILKVLDIFRSWDANGQCAVPVCYCYIFGSSGVQCDSETELRDVLEPPEFDAVWMLLGGGQ